MITANISLGALRLCHASNVGSGMLQELVCIFGECAVRIFSPTGAALYAYTLPPIMRSDGGLVTATVTPFGFCAVTAANNVFINIGFYRPNAVKVQCTGQKTHFASAHCLEVPDSELY